MAEGLASNLLGSTIDAYSAGTEPYPLNDHAVKVMQEIGIDISAYKPKNRTEFDGTTFDLIITVCDNAAKSCPTPPAGSKILHVPFDDPPHLAQGASSEQDAIKHYRRVRDEIKQFVLTLPAILDHC